MATLHGTVIASKPGWGFITPDDPNLVDIFYHRTSLLDGRKRLIQGEIVEFEIGERNSKPIALNVRVIVSKAPTAENYVVPAVAPAKETR